METPEKLDQIRKQVISEFNDKRLLLSQIGKIAKALGVKDDVVMGVVHSLQGVTMSYRRVVGNNWEEVPTEEFSDKMRQWWRDKTLSEEEWQEYASQIQVSWVLP